MTLFFAGIGSRETPPETLLEMKDLAYRLALRGYVLRSGGADGADSAFEDGCLSANGPSEIWVPKSGYKGRAPSLFVPERAHYDLASTIHPGWDDLPFGKGLIARNMGQILGGDLETPVSFVVCWTRDGCESHTNYRPGRHGTGGTGSAIALASRRGIPVFNLKNPDAKIRLNKHVFRDLRTFHADGELPTNGEILVFGSNLAGRHGKGSALVAKEQYGAIYGQGVGRQGQSYAVPTKDGRDRALPLSDTRNTLPLLDIKKSVDDFVRYAWKHKEETFYVVRLGCDLANHKNEDVAPLFAQAPLNCIMPEPWRPWLGRSVNNEPVYDVGCSLG